MKKNIFLFFALALCSSFSFVFSKQEVVVLYSGGLDSSAVVGYYAIKGYDTIHLLTFDNGAQKNLSLCNVKIDEFRSTFPKTHFIHSIKNSSYLFKKVALVDIESDFVKYKTNLICVGCKMAMHAMAIIYALENKIGMVADGYAKRQDDFPEQDISAIQEMKAIYSKFNIRYESPLYDVLKSKDATKDLLAKYGLSTKSIEGECLFGGTFSKGDSQSIAAYAKAKASIIVDFIKDYFSERGLTFFYKN